MQSPLATEYFLQRLTRPAKRFRFARAEGAMCSMVGPKMPPPHRATPRLAPGVHQSAHLRAKKHQNHRSFLVQQLLIFAHRCQDAGYPGWVVVPAESAHLSHQHHR